MSNVVKMSDYQTKEVVIDGITVKQDVEGRYCLNDIHKAADELCTVKTSPAQWARTDMAKEFTDHLITQKRLINPITSKVGQGGGTYAVKQLVYAYAMWISPAYQLKVIEAYDRLATEGVAVHDAAAQDLLDNPLKYLTALMGQAQKLVEENARLEQKVEQDKPKVQVFDKLVDANGLLGFQEFCTGLNLNQRTIKMWLREIGWLRAHQWERGPLPTAKAVQHGYCYIKKEESEFGFKQTLMFTNKAEAYVELKAPDWVRKDKKAA